jgi:thermosome
LILKEGTSESHGSEAWHSNISAATIVAEVVRTSLGPKGMDKMLVSSFGDVTITNDGATILNEMEIQHPAAKMMVEISKTQDKEVGDGTTSVVILAGELLLRAEELLEQNIHPAIIIDGYRGALDQAIQRLDKVAIRVEPTDKDVLSRIATTSISGKVIAERKEEISRIVVEALLSVATKERDGYKVDIDNVKIQKKAGESVSETSLVRGIIIDKEVVNASMPKTVENSRIALLDCALEIKKTEFTEKINIESPDKIKAFMDEEASMLKGMVDRITKAGANVVVCQKGIDDLAQQFLARNGVLAVRRAKKSDLEALSKATGGKIITNLEDLSAKDLGIAKLTAERKVSGEKWVFVEGCKNPKAVTILARGGTKRLVDEVERSMHDAIMVVKDVIEQPQIVAGGGAVEMELFHHVNEWAQRLSGKEQLAALAFAKSLEKIPLTLAENSGLDQVDILTRLRAEHQKGHVWMGIDAFSGNVADMKALDVVEPVAVKKHLLNSATEAATMIIRIDDVIAASKMRETGPGPKKGPSEGGEE